MNKLVIGLVCVITLLACSPHQVEQKVSADVTENVKTMVSAPTEPVTIQYEKFFTYPFVDDGHAEIQPAFYTKLAMNDKGCLTGQTGNILVFPHGISRWSEEKQALIIREQLEFKLGDRIFSNGLGTEIYQVGKNFDFAQQANLECLVDGAIIQFVGSQIQKPTKEIIKSFEQN